MLYKVASKKKKKKQKRDDKLLAGIAATSASKSTLGMGSTFATLTAPTEKIDRETIKRINEAINGNKNVRADISDFRHYIASSYDPGYLTKKKPTVHVSGDSPVAVVAHELGHANSKFINNKLGYATYVASKISSPFAGLIGIYRLNDAYKNHADKKKIKELERQNAISTVVASSPVVYEETRANLKALQALSRLGKLNVRNVLPIIASEASYLTLPATGFISNKVLEELYDKD